VHNSLELLFQLIRIECWLFIGVLILKSIRSVVLLGNLVLNLVSFLIIRDKWLYFYFIGLHSDILFRFWASWIIVRNLDAVNLCCKTCIGCNEVSMKSCFGKFYLEKLNRRSTFRQSPKQSTIFILLIKWVYMNQLQYAVMEKLLELESCQSDAIIK